MIGIKNVGVYIPNKKVSNLDKLSKFETTEDFVINKIGIEKVAVKEETEDVSDMCVKAFEDLKKLGEIDLDTIKICILITQNPESNIPHSSALIHDKLNLPNDCACFDISLGCSGYVYGLSVVKSLMESNNIDDALLFTCDPYSKIMDYDDKNTSLLFGDAATATYITRNEPILTLGKFTFGTVGKESHNLTAGIDGSKLYMNGRGIYNFVIRNIPKDLEKLYALNEIDKSSIDLFLFHQGSKYMIDVLTKRMKLDPDKVIFSAKNYGNTVSSSIPILVKDRLASDADKIAISGFGVGLSWSSTILKRNK
ncbi:ketoacyl-ACP synthase III [Aquimarina sp. MMG016]|uniref:ketoacyl-ACP synthase III n=1 Tax=Aquimarina sp. MMG016 TaxID=2822690 RepID=UPI001B3A1D5E|nr:ketoacyl-ACP synthase III [Aquimarina sp. MMG016]MBQ4820079.1 ketoacyl-ACP synthase III [Aquimarina sp. MMG016]